MRTAQDLMERNDLCVSGRSHGTALMYEVEHRARD
jgi:hypothetical protein